MNLKKVQPMLLQVSMLFRTTGPFVYFPGCYWSCITVLVHQRSGIFFSNRLCKGKSRENHSASRQTFQKTRKRPLNPIAASRLRCPVWELQPCSADGLGGAWSDDLDSGGFVFEWFCLIRKIRSDFIQGARLGWLKRRNVFAYYCRQYDAAGAVFVVYFPERHAFFMSGSG